MELEIKQGSVITADVDAIVNSANEELCEGGGVCGAIFQASGRKELQKECNAIGGCRTGHAVLTNGYKLKKYIIHAVGPIYNNDNDAKTLKSAITNALCLADCYKFKSIGLVPISTGIFGYPILKASKIIIQAVRSFKPKYLKTCYLYCYTHEEFQVFKDTYNKINLFPNGTTKNQKDDLILQSIKSGRLRTSFIQSTLGISYPRARKIFEYLVEQKMFVFDSNKKEYIPNITENEYLEKLQD